MAILESTTQFCRSEVHLDAEAVSGKLGPEESLEKHWLPSQPDLVSS